MDKETESTELKSAKNQSLNPFADLRLHLHDLEKRFDDVRNSRFFHPLKLDWPEWSGFEALGTDSPKVDIINQDTKVLVRAEMPGVKKEGINISLTADSITLKSESIEEKEEKSKDNYYRRETMSKSFSRTLKLPCDVETNDARATFEDGILEVLIPKTEKEKNQSVTID